MTHLGLGVGSAVRGTRRVRVRGQGSGALVGLGLPKVEAREEEAEGFDSLEAGARRERRAEEDHEKEGERRQDLHDLQRQARVEAYG